MQTPKQTNDKQNIQYGFTTTKTFVGQRKKLDDKCNCNLSQWVRKRAQVMKRTVSANVRFSASSECSFSKCLFFLRHQRSATLHKIYSPILRSFSVSSTTMQLATMSYTARLWWKQNTVKHAGKQTATEKFFITDRTSALKQKKKKLGATKESFCHRHKPDSLVKQGRLSASRTRLCHICLSRDQYTDSIWQVYSTFGKCKGEGG